MLDIVCSVHCRLLVQCCEELLSTSQSSCYITLWEQILQHPDPWCTCRQNGTSNVHTSSAILLNDLLRAREGNQLSYIDFENLDYFNDRMKFLIIQDISIPILQRCNYRKLKDS